MNKKTRRNSKATTTIHDLYTDCLVSILAFVKPLEMWYQRSTCSSWRKTVPVALARVTTYRFGHSELDFVESVINLCPNLTIIRHDTVSRPWVKK